MMELNDQYYQQLTGVFALARAKVVDNNALDRDSLAHLINMEDDLISKLKALEAVKEPKNGKSKVQKVQ